MTPGARLHSIAGTQEADGFEFALLRPGGFVGKMSERRKYPRYGFQSDVEVVTVSTVTRAFITDISLGGMFIVTQAPQPVGRTFTARLLLDPPLILSCEVRRVLPGKGMGATFTEISEADQIRLEKLLAWLASG